MSQKIIAFQGLRGAYSELAIEAHFAGPSMTVVPLPLPSFDAVFASLITGQADAALLPFENSLAGMIHENFDLLARREVEIVGEHILAVQHCLLTAPGMKQADIDTVISHPQALAQCANFIRQNGWKPEAFFDTAGAAAHLARERPSGTAAIASSQAARLYQLEIAATGIADQGENLTRFLHLEKKGSRVFESGGKGRAVSLLLVRLHAAEPGLTQLLKECELEVLHCEARPTKEAAWTYYYFLEVAAHPGHPAWPEALDRLQRKAQSVRVMGSYYSQR